MNIDVQIRGNNIEARVSNKYKLLVVSMEGLSLLNKLLDYKAPVNFFKITKERKKIFIRKCIVKLANELLKVNKE